MQDADRPAPNLGRMTALVSARRARQLTLILLLALALPTAARASEIVQQKQYVLGVDTPGRNIFYVACEQPPSLGGACFQPPNGASKVRFAIDDVTRTHPGAVARFLDAGGTTLATNGVCASVDHAIPPGTNRIQVLVDGVSNRDTCGSTAAGTTGTITATFTIDDAEPPGPGYVPSQPIHNVRAERKQYIASGDSTIQVDVYRPDTPGRFPVIVWFDVYYKDDPGAVVNSERDFFVTRGYVFVHASSPGSNTSGGTYENAFGPAEQQAATDVVEWAGTQPWSTGAVAMEGLSYAAIIQYFVAARRPPHLVTIYPTSAYSDLYREIVYTGGNLQAGYPIVWDANNRALAVAPPQSVASDPVTEVGNYATTVAGYRPILPDYVLHPYADDFYAVRSPATRNNAIAVPAAIDVGWHDDMVYGGPINFETLGSADKRLVIGPWGHSAAHRRAGGREERLRWMDFYLKGMASGVDTDPRARVFIPDGGNDEAGSYIDANAWPLPGTAHVPLYLGTSGSLRDTLGASGSASYTFSPTRHSGTSVTAETVRFETPPLEQPVTVVGYPELILHASTDARDTSWNAAVYDVAPDGRATELQRGWLRAGARELDDARSIPGRPFHRFARDLPVRAGETNEYRIAIMPFANRFPASHRIRIELDDEPTGPGGAPALMPPYAGTNTIFYGDQTPSRVLLPIL